MASSVETDEVNKLIMDHLAQFDEDVRILALTAIRLSERHPTNAVIEQMMAQVRKSVREAGEYK